MKTSRNTVLITGGGTGIGRALADALLSAGNTVIICGRRKSKLAEVKAIHPGIHTLHCDVATKPNREALHKEVVEKFPAINMLINNAGIQRPIDLKQGAKALEGEDEIEVNLNAYVHLASLFIPDFLKKDSAIINVSSGLGFVPISIFPIYCATKAAVHSFSLSLRHQLKQTSIKVFEIIPPIVDTDLDHGRRPADRRGIPPTVVANTFLDALAKDRYQIPVGEAENLVKGDFAQNYKRMNP